MAVAVGHRYLTTVLDLETGAILFVGEGKRAEGLRPFWERLRRSGAKIEAMATDLAPAYCVAAETILRRLKSGLRKRPALAKAGG